MSDEVIFQDFTEERPPIRFSAQGQKYDCYPSLSVTALQRMGKLAEGTDPSNLMEGFEKFFALCMDAENANRIKQQIRSSENNLTPSQCLKIMQWLMERYGMRPLGQSETSSDGSPAESDGTSSTAGVSPEA